MVNEHERLNDHEKFKELCALASAGALRTDELAELEGHLGVCDECREVYAQYLILARDGFPALAACFSQDPGQGSWNDAATRRKLFARVGAAEELASSESRTLETVTQEPFAVLCRLGNVLERIPLKQVIGAALAACLLVAVGFVAHRLGNREQARSTQPQAFNEDRFQALEAEKKSLEELLSAERTKLSQLHVSSLGKGREISKLRSESSVLVMHLKEISAANGAMEEQLRILSQQRDALSGQLRGAEQAYQSIQPELASLREYRQDALQRIDSLESRIGDLSVANLDYERKARNIEQLLASDRDIRELMGARNLYIADVFDVDSRSRMRKPFGRVFYTRGKSLIFYAFDLDLQPGISNASTFQGWGREGSGHEKALSLGIFYMDNASNHEWILRCNNPEQLAEIDSVFVTVEPSDRSKVPTGNPLLFALLRKEVNHP
jgi:hypothetical protein